ncbi:uncharacterized protein LOC129233618 [Uloborus diversus]|uniref:uncharacterized protein LOC129233618 n=1 Tax=Uloborus diversus TaxID=327109 RepID=UPI002409ED0A|nr:uncharacterized protein LOC129233618 [Uloborus diversus]
MAGKEWVLGFRKRNSTITLRKPENTSVARSLDFNKTAVLVFYQNYESVLARYQFTGSRIFNFDETAITTVLSAPKVLAHKAQKQIGRIVSAEKGDLVTFVGIVSVTGTAVPPAFVFPRVHFKNHFLEVAPKGSLRLATKSGWMNADLHLKVLEHIKNHANCSAENPILLLCDNHEAHVSIAAIDYCKEKGIIYLSFPPHTSHKMQPLDVAVFDPFKGKLKIAFNDWHLNHPGRGLTIYDIPKPAKLAYFEAFTPKNIMKGFETPGIHPFNRLAFSDSHFAPLEVYKINTTPPSNDALTTSSAVTQTPLDLSSDQTPNLQIQTVPDTVP